MHVGIDEAGKGPVIGSMFAAAIAVPDPAILPAGIDDSKQLSESSRQELYHTLKNHDRVYLETADVSPVEIDAPETDMNTLTVDAHARALESLLDTIPIAPTQIIADAGDTDAARFGTRIADRCSAEVDISATHGADSQHSIVGAASIVAKSHREQHVQNLADQYGKIGSGYPSDQVTRSFLVEYYRENREFPPFVRSSWQTCADIIARFEQSGLEEF